MAAASRKKAESSRKKKKGRSSWKVDRGVRTEIQGLVTLALSALLVLALYHPSPGFVGNLMRLLLTALLGRAAWTIPLLVTMAGVAWVGKIPGPSVVPRMVGLALGGLAAAAFYQAGMRALPPFSLDALRAGGGYLGAGMTWMLTSAFGPLGRTVVLLACSVVAALLVVNVPGTRVGTTVVRGAGGFIAGVVSGVRGFLVDEDEDEPTRDAPPQEVAIHSYPEDSDPPEAAEALGAEGNGSAKDPPIVTARGRGSEEPKPGDTESPPAGDRPGRKDDLPVGADVGRAGVESPYVLPTPTLLSGGGTSRALGDSARTELNRKARLLESTLRDFGIKARVLEISHGPAVTRFDMHPGPGVKVSQIVSLADDIALSMATTGVRVVAPVPGKSAVGIEVPNRQVASVSLREIVESREFRKAESLLSIALGADITGRPLIVNLEDLLHVLIAGATGSGKSISIRCVIASLLFRARPDQVKLLLIDPKVVEFMTYDGLPHLLTPVVTDAKKAAGCLTWAVKEMERRYRHFAERGVRDLPSYNRRAVERGEAQIPRIVIIIDELADLMMVARVDVEDAIQRLAQMARAAGIHLVVATQRPSVDVITGVIKANIPSRIAFAVSSSADSRTILDAGGAEKLLGHGDMLFSPVGRDRAIRAQGSFLSDEDLETLLDYARQQGDPEYREEVMEAAETESTSSESGDESDPKLEEAIVVVMEAGEASVSMLQRRLRVGYTRAGRLMDTMENMGVVGPYQGSKAREVLMSRSRYLAQRGETEDEEVDES